MIDLSTIRATAVEAWEAHGAGPSYDRSIREHAGDVVRFIDSDRTRDALWAHAKLLTALGPDRATATWSDVTARFEALLEVA